MNPPIEWEANAWRYRWVTLLLCWEFIGLSIWVSVFLWEPSGIYFPHTARREREFECMRRELAEYFSRFQSLFSGLNYNIWNSLNAEARDPSSYKQQKGDFKKNLSGFFPQTPPCHHLLFHNDLTKKEWSSGSQSTGHHMLITNISLQLCSIMTHCWAQSDAPFSSDRVFATPLCSTRKSPHIPPKSCCNIWTFGFCRAA